MLIYDNIHYVDKAWISHKIVDAFLDFYKSNLREYHVSVGDEFFVVRSNYKVENAISDFYVNKNIGAIGHEVYIIHTVENEFLRFLFEHASDKESACDYLLLRCEHQTWLLSSVDTNTGITICLNMTEDQWGEPITEQIRWHIATHIMHYLESKMKFSFHASAIKKGDRVVVLFGEPTAGKSTQVARALMNNWHLISDDRVVFYLRNTNSVYVDKFWKSIKLRGDVHHIGEVQALLETRPTIISSYPESGHGISNRYIFSDKLSNSGGIVTDYFILTNESDREMSKIDIYNFLSDSLFTSGLGDKEYLVNKRREIGKIISTILSHQIRQIDGKKDFFETIL